MTRPGTSVNSTRFFNFPMSGSSRPDRPGVPARGSPRFNVTTRWPTQNTPGKLQGSEVKSHEEKKVEPGMSSSDFLMDCSAKKSMGCNSANEY
ncbi:hypothetical protein HanIR_Chr10g0458221 [Helianthus annuus]|nr:hypothetical protein HanIR_Chr10g0458221 [Helianthus annuus]